MHWVDIVVLAIIGISVLIGLFRGLVKESISLATWLLALWAGLTYGPKLAGLLPFSVGSQTVQSLIGIAILFVVVVIVGGIVNYLVGQLVDRTGLSGTDRMLGLIFGVLRGGLIVAVLVLLAMLTNLPNEPWWKDSMTLPFFQEIAVWIRDMLPPSLAEHFS